MERRSFLASLALLGVDLTALAPASSAQAGSAGDRTLIVDGALLRDLDLTIAAYERMRHRVPGHHLMRQVVGHIELTEDVLRGSLWPAQKQRLLANLSQTTSLLSWLLFFDRGDRAAARAWLMRGGRNARPVSPGPSGPTGVKLEPPQPPVGRLAVPGRRRRRRGGTSLTPAVCRAGW